MNNEVVKIKANIIEQEILVVPKIVYGIDNKGYAFIYFKMKDFNNNSYLKQAFIIMYQDVNIPGVMERKNTIMEWIQKHFETGSIRNFKSKNHFFIKKKLFRNFSKIVKFYDNIIYGIVSDFGININPQVLKNISEKGTFTKDFNYPLNYYEDKQ